MSRSPLRLLAQAVLRAPGTVAAVQDAVLLREEHLQGAAHLLWLAEQQARVEQLEAWRRRHQATGSESTRAFLAELSEAVKRYMSLVLQPVVDALSACERGLLNDSRHGARRSGCWHWVGARGGHSVGHEVAPVGYGVCRPGQ